MDNQAQNAAWNLWYKRRSWLILSGKISAVFFLLAVLLLLDGLQALVRTSSDTISLVAGESTGLSGPCPFQNPVASDLKVSFTPKDGDLEFELEGFFAGYLLGNGMWRGVIKAKREAETKSYKLKVSFKGADAQGQSFSILIFHDFAAYCQAQPSFSLAYLGLKPFLFSAFLAALGFFFGLCTYLWSKKNLKLLNNLGYAEVFRLSPGPEDPRLLWCSSLGLGNLKVGDKFQVYSVAGKFLGLALLKSQAKNVLCLTISRQSQVSLGCLVQIKPQD
ncbi:MAG: hypothetical protein IJU40_00630 [Desulfovibrionaceae bacterium]|nr:hypothetical protein [Desulfovibrionaceae bacterium]